MSDVMGDLNPATHRQVALLLGAERADEMLGLLNQTVTELAGMSHAELAGRDGLRLVHRLKSEAGLMGFDRLSRACEIVDAAGARGAVPSGDLKDLKIAVTGALTVVASLRECRGAPVL